MIPIRMGDTGRGVEDIQRRLLQLGYDLGSGGVDSDFGEETQSAVEAFQKDVGLTVTGAVGSHTWSALVDSTFVFGDRSLYLRKPHFHGQDVSRLQRALTSLGFFAGDIDGIFGPVTERAVIDFQSNMAIPPDGAVGLLTYEALNGLKHIWDNREVHRHSEATHPTLEREPILNAFSWCFVATDQETRQIVRRLFNLAVASAEHADITQCSLDDPRGALSLDALTPETVRVAVAQSGSVEVLGEELRAIVVPYDAHRANLIHAWLEAIARNPQTHRCATILVPSELFEVTNKLTFQFTASVILDTLCAVYSA